MDIFVIDFLKDFCYAKFISKTLPLRNYVQVQPHPTGAKNCYTRLEEVNSDFFSSDSPVSHWLKKYVNYFFFFPVASWLINDGFFPSETPVTGVNVSFSCMNFLVSRNCQIT